METNTLGSTAPLVGMVHLPPLPGAPGYSGTDGRTAVRERACADARALADAGFDAVLVENYGDAPYYPEDVPPHTVAELTAIVEAVRGAVDCPVGVNVLRNDATAALSVAAATGGAFVRVNVHTGLRATDQGPLAGQAHETLRLRERVDADVAVLADVAVKHSAGLADRDIQALAEETVDRGFADGLVVSGPATGTPADESRLSTVCRARTAATRDVPVLVGSGVTPENAPALLNMADGAIVGTATKEAAMTANPVDPERARALVERARIVR
jgi:membrane complex biogenesis BtpA family protein